MKTKKRLTIFTRRVTKQESGVRSQESGVRRRKINSVFWILSPEFRVSVIVALFALIAMTATATPLFADAYTKLLLHLDEDIPADYSTSSLSITVPSCWGTEPQISSAQSTFGGSSYCFYPDSEGCLIAGSNTGLFDFQSDPFTVDFWMYPTNLGANRDIWSINRINNYQWLHCFTDSSGGIHFGLERGENTYAGQYGGIWDVHVQTPSGTVSINNWYHIAAVRNGNDWKIFVNGIEKGYSYNSMSVYPFDWTQPPYVGCMRYTSWTGRHFAGYIDEFRISKGIARWTENFIPHGSPQLFDDISAGMTFLELDYDDLKKDQLYDLYCAGKEGTNPENITIDGTQWEYSSGNLPGDTDGLVYNIGDTWEIDGVYYIKLGSGLIGEPLGGAPELPAGAVPFIGTVLGAVLARKRKSQRVIACYVR